MTREEFREALNDRGIYRQVDAAAALGLKQQTVSNYLRGRNRVPGVVEVALRAIPKQNGKASAKSRAGGPGKAA